MSELQPMETADDEEKLGEGLAQPQRDIELGACPRCGSALVKDYRQSIRSIVSITVICVGLFFAAHFFLHTSLQNPPYLTLVAFWAGGLVNLKKGRGLWCMKCRKYPLLFKRRFAALRTKQPWAPEAGRDQYGGFYKRPHLSAAVDCPRCGAVLVKRKSSALVWGVLVLAVSASVTWAFLISIPSGSPAMWPFALGAVAIFYFAYERRFGLWCPSCRTHHRGPYGGLR